MRVSRSLVTWIFQLRRAPRDLTSRSSASSSVSTRLLEPKVLQEDRLVHQAVTLDSVSLDGQQPFLQAAEQD